VRVITKHAISCENSQAQRPTGPAIVPSHRTEQNARPHTRCVTKVTVFHRADGDHTVAALFLKSPSGHVRTCANLIQSPQNKTCALRTHYTHHYIHCMTTLLTQECRTQRTRYSKRSSTRTTTPPLKRFIFLLNRLGFGCQRSKS
jgi:hypothetical protein